MVSDPHHDKHGHAGAADDEESTDNGSVVSEFSTFRDDGPCGTITKGDSSSHKVAALRNGRDGVPGSTRTCHTVYQALPLFQKGQMVYDCCIFIWVNVSHLLLTFWPLCGLAIMAGSLYSRTLAYITIIALGTMLLPPCQHTQRVVAMLNMCVFHYWKRHISLKIVHEPGFDSQQQYLVTCFPHGGCVPANFKTLLRELGAGHSAMVHAGGIAEMFVCETDREVIVLRNRRGFVRAAVQHGVPLLPVYYFGNSQLLSFGPKSLRPLSRQLKMSIGLVYGVLGLPILRHRPVTAVVGTPIPVGPATPPDSPDYVARVEALHQQFTEALSTLYAKHCGEHSSGSSTWAARPLVVT